MNNDERDDPVLTQEEANSLAQSQEYQIQYSNGQFMTTGSTSGPVVNVPDGIIWQTSDTAQNPWGQLRDAWGQPPGLIPPPNNYPGIDHTIDNISTTYTIGGGLSWFNLEFNKIKDSEGVLFSTKYNKAGDGSSVMPTVHMNENYEVILTVSDKIRFQDEKTIYIMLKGKMMRLKQCEEQDPLSVAFYVEGFKKGRKIPKPKIKPVDEFSNIRRVARNLNG